MRTETMQNQMCFISCLQNIDFEILSTSKILNEKVKIGCHFQDCLTKQRHSGNTLCFVEILNAAGSTGTFFEKENSTSQETTR